MYPSNMPSPGELFYIEQQRQLREMHAAREAAWWASLTDEQRAEIVQERQQAAERQRREQAEQDAREQAEQDAREQAEQDAREQAEQDAREQAEQGRRAAEYRQVSTGPDQSVGHVLYVFTWVIVVFGAISLLALALR